MQNMHPQLGAAVEEHSIFFQERMAAAAALAVPDRRRGVRRRPCPEDGCARCATTTSTSRASTRKGRRYHALNPDVFYWAHSTFFVGTILVAERFCGGITEDEKRQLFDEHIAWYRMYGMSMRPVPETWEDFQVYWDHMCRNVLENNKATRDVLDLRELPKPPFVQRIPDWMCAPAATAARAAHASGSRSACTTRRCAN